MKVQLRHILTIIILSGLLLPSFSFTYGNPDTPGYTFQAKGHSDNPYNATSGTGGYNDFNYIQVILAYGEEHAITLLWTREIDLNQTANDYSSWTTVSGETNFVEQDDPRNCYELYKDFCTVEVKEEGSYTYVRVNFVGSFLLNYPTRAMQDAKVIVTSHENNEEIYEVFQDVYWVETEPFWRNPTNTESSLTGWKHQNYWQPYKNPSTSLTGFVYADYWVPNFQKLSYSFDIVTNETFPASHYNFDHDFHIQFYFRDTTTAVVSGYEVEFNTYSNVSQDVYDKIWTFLTGYPATTNHYCVEMKFREYTGVIFVDVGTGGEVNLLTTPQEGIRQASFKVEAWITEDNRYFGLRVINGEYYGDDGDEYTASWDNATQTVIEDVQYAEWKFSLPQNWLELNPWVQIRVMLEYDSPSDGYAKIDITKEATIVNQRKMGVSDPPLVLPEPTDDLPWWIRPIVEALRWLANAIYTLLKPLFDAIVNALGQTWIWIVENVVPILKAFIVKVDELIYGLTGHPHVLSTLLNFIADAAGFIVTNAHYVPDALGYVTTLVLTFMSQIAKYGSDLLGVITWFIDPVVKGFQSFMNVWGGGFGGLSDFWYTYKIREILFLAVLLSMWWIFEQCRRQKSLDPLLNALEHGMTIFTFLVDFFWKIANIVYSATAHLIRLIKWW